MDVVALDKKTCDLFVKEKHYSRRPPMFQYGFGLVEDGKIEGVVVYGSPPAQIAKHAFVDRDFELLELTRLVVQTKTKNAASFLIAKSLRMLPAPCAVVSYADTEQAHCGIVYQATNWEYAGATVSHDSMYILDGKRVHPRTLASRGITAPKQWAKENNIEMVKPLPKHRYFYFVGSKAKKAYMKGKLKYQIGQPYPKMDQRRYDDGPTLEVAFGP